MKIVILVAALGYFVDVFDLILFSVIRIESLKSLGLNEAQILDQGVYLINIQMLGMLAGGVLWGMVGDKRGRVSVLFGSILMYSVANIANAAVQTVEGYAFWRFIAGIGLAGELGAGITLVSEMMPREKRGYGTTIVATVGVLGAVIASITGSYFNWRTNYYIGGFLGLSLLVLRIAISESGLFQTIKTQEVKRGSLVLLFSSKERTVRYMQCILIGVPIWATVGILVTFSPEIGAALGIKGQVSSAAAVFYAFAGLTAGDLCSGLFSQFLKSRKKVIYFFLALSAIFASVLLMARGWPVNYFHWLFFPMGFAVGYWAMFVTVAAEQFGTNLRATVATSVPNFVRGAVVPMTYLFRELISVLGIVSSAAVVFAAALLIALIAAIRLKESFHTELDFIES